MVTNEKIITINRPVAEVFAYVSDLPRGTEWQPGLVEVRRITEGPEGVGTQYYWRTQIHGSQDGVCHRVHNLRAE